MTKTVEQYNEVFEREALGLEGHAVDTVEHTIYYETASNSDSPERTFLLVHGAACTGRFMNPVAHKLIEKIPNSKVIVVDLPFHGYSIASESIEKININSYTEIMLEALELLKEEKEIVGALHWIGWSMGGSIGLLASLTDAGIDELTLLNSSPVWKSVEGMLAVEPLMNDEKAITEVFKAVVAGELKLKTEVELQEAFAEYYYDIVATGKVMTTDLQGITPKYFNVLKELENIKTKTLVISGTQDPLAEVHYQEVMRDYMPDAELLLLEDNHALLLKPYAVEIIVDAIAKRFTK